MLICNLSFLQVFKDMVLLIFQDQITIGGTPNFVGRKGGGEERATDILNGSFNHTYIYYENRGGQFSKRNT